MRVIFFLLFCFGGFISLHAQSTVLDESTQKFIYHNEPTGFVLIESLDPGMTLYGLSRKYNLSIGYMLDANPDLNPEAIPLGYPVNIPIDIKAITFTLPQMQTESFPVFYRVQPKETLYRISKVYLGVSPETLIALNPRIDQGLSIGQVLHLGWYIPQANTYNTTSVSSVEELDSGLYPVKDFNKEYKAEGKTLREQKGLAVWKPGNMQSHYYVLHSTAKVGTYMEVTNPMLHRTLTAKVAGNIPPGLYQSHVGLVVSPSVARALGVLDQQFFARWRFVE